MSVYEIISWILIFLVIDDTFFLEKQTKRGFAIKHISEKSLNRIWFVFKGKHFAVRFGFSQISLH